MPRYLLEAKVVTASGSAAAIELAARRFPEVAVEHCYVAHDAAGARTTWVCRAPSEAHLQRWAATGGLPLVAVRRVDADHSADRRMRVTDTNKECRS